MQIMRTSMPFKPKAQILLQLGEQLIKSESVAILELIKNAYDADAKNVSVSMIDIDVPQTGYIEIVDDGVGMNLWTVQNIWMEPGNTHKKDIVLLLNDLPSIDSLLVKRVSGGLEFISLGRKSK